MIYASSILALGFVWLLVQREPIVHLAQNSMLICSVVGIILFSMFHGQNARDGVAKALAAAAVGLGLIGVFLQSGLVGEPTVVAEYVVYAAMALLVIFVGYGFKYHNSDEYSRTVVLMILIVSTTDCSE